VFLPHLPELTSAKNLFSVQIHNFLFIPSENSYEKGAYTLKEISAESVPFH